MKSARVLVDRVLDLADDPGATDAMALTLINSAISLFSEDVIPSTLVVPFYQLDVDADEELVSLPEDCMPLAVMSAFNSSKKQISIYKSAVDAEEAFVKYSNPAKDVSAVLISDNALRVLPVASEATSIYITYVKNPTLYEDINDDGSSITFLRGALAEDMLVYFAVSRIYNRIEDGVTDRRQNFKIYNDLYMQVYAQLMAKFLPTSNQGRPQVVGGFSFNGSIGMIPDPLEMSRL